MQRVGWIISHPPRENGFFLSGPEVICAAELQLEAAGGVEETSFVTIKVTLDAENQVIVEGFQARLDEMRYSYRSIGFHCHDWRMFSLSADVPTVHGVRG